MSFESMLNHKCDIYHINKEDVSPGYGLPASPSFSYPDEPNQKGAICKFHTKGGSRQVIQREPQAVFESRVKLSLLKGTDIRLNDKIVDCETGVEYTAEVPHKIKDHHITVMLRRTFEQELL